MLEYNEIKNKAKAKGLKLQSIAEMVGYTYQGFIKAVKENRLRHDARMELQRILDIDLDINISEPSEHYNISLVDELKHINTMLLEQIKVKDKQIEMLTELLKTQKNIKSTKYLTG